MSEQTLDAIQITEEGLILPRQLFSGMGEIEIVPSEAGVLIKPKNMTARFKGLVHPCVSVPELHQDYEESLLEALHESR